MSTLFETNLNKINSISTLESNYLKILKDIAKCPKRLYFKGQLPETRLISVAIVGTRRPTPYGVEVTRQFASGLASRGVVIVSGLALGIDSVSHRSAIEVGGLTIAVLGNGLDQIYPANNYDLAKNIIKSDGAIISEYELGIEARDFRFLERNRIVSGLADAILITEASIRSGTMSTAAHALEQGREVFVVPGNITSPLSAGCNRLIQQGAHPATCVEDILEIIAPQLIKSQTTLPLGNNPLETKIIQLIQSGVRDGDEIFQISGCDSLSEFLQTMTMMELSGVIRPLGGNQWTLR
jgi:DNA processing protein